MGKTNRKFKKKQEQLATAARQEENSLWETTLREQMNDGQYEKAIETLAELVKGDDLQPKFMYDAAYCYFMVGDHERAANWINNTLTYLPGHIGARILLARLLILEERVDDGLAVFDYILDKARETLSEEQQEEIEDITEFYGRSERDKILRDYPHIAAFLELEEEKPTESPATLLKSLKEKVRKATEPVKETASEARAESLEQIKQRVAQASEAVREAKETAAGTADEAVPEGKEAIAERPDDARRKPAELLQALKQRLAAANEAMAAPPAVPAESPAPPTVGAPAAMGERAESADREIAAESQDEVLAAAEKTRQEVVSRDIFASEKAAILNSFAAAYYYQRQPQAAKLLLKEAVRLDKPSDALLRNLALVEFDLGYPETALQCASMMQTADFLLLRLLREQS